MRRWRRGRRGAALHHLNLTDAFDGVYGSSAGTLIGAYFLSRQLLAAGGGPRLAALGALPPALLALARRCDASCE